MCASGSLECDLFLTRNDCQHITNDIENGAEHSKTERGKNTVRKEKRIRGG